MMATRSDLVSIIIISHNYGRFLGEAIESALAQTYRNTEVIVVDDASTDESALVARRYPVRLIVHPRRSGVARAVDTGLTAASGASYVLLSADDTLHAEYVNKTSTVLADHPEASFVYTQSIKFGAESGVLPYAEYNIDRLLEGNFIPGTALTRTAIYRLVGGYDQALPCLEDWDHWLVLAERGFTGVLLPEPLFSWRRHAQGSRNTPPAKVLENTIHRIRRKHWQLYLSHARPVGWNLLCLALRYSVAQYVKRLARLIPSGHDNPAHLP